MGEFFLNYIRTQEETRKKRFIKPRRCREQQISGRSGSVTARNMSQKVKCDINCSFRRFLCCAILIDQAPQWIKQTASMIYKALDSSLPPKLGVFSLPFPSCGNVFLAFSFGIHSSRHSNKYKLKKVRRKTSTIKQAPQNK